MSMFYPIFLGLAGKKAVVVGGGRVAARKAGSLASAGAKVTIISPELAPEAAVLAAKGIAVHVPRRYRAGDLEGAYIVVAATDDPATNLDVAREAGSAGVLVNCARPPEAGNFIVPSSINRGGLTLAISTGGACPALSKRLRKEMDAFLGREYGPFLEFLDSARAYLKDNVKDEGRRAGIITALVESELIADFRVLGHAQAIEKGRAMLMGFIEALYK